MSESNEVISVGFKRLDDEAILPTKAHKEDSGFDLYALEDTVIEPEETILIKTGIAINLPPGYEAQIRPRSGVTLRTNLRVQLGTIDNEYTGELGVIADNRVSKNVFKTRGLDTIRGGGHSLNETHQLGALIVLKGDKVAQLVIQKLPEVVPYEVLGDMKDASRGNKGYGSSGV